MVDWKEKLGAAFNVDPTAEVEAVPQEVAPKSPLEQQGKTMIDIILDKKGRNGKKATIVVGLKLDDENLKALAADLKRHCGVGGSFLSNCFVFSIAPADSCRRKFSSSINICIFAAMSSMSSLLAIKPSTPSVMISFIPPSQSVPIQAQPWVMASIRLLGQPSNRDANMKILFVRRHSAMLLFHPFHDNLSFFA